MAIFTLLPLLFKIAVICTITSVQAQDKESPAPLVQVNFYGEALCPYCARFVDTVARIQDVGVLDLTNFRFIPYGNAKDTKDGVKCQHGPNECKLNRLVSCAIHLNPDQNVWFPFVKCLESQVLSKVHPLEPAEQCAADAGINFTAVQECASGAMADELQKQAADETANLSPPHSYVPWITVNGVALGGAYEELQIFICAAYLGDRPEVCYRPPSVAATAVTHAGLSQVLKQLDHSLGAKTT